MGERSIARAKLWQANEFTFDKLGKYHAKSEAPPGASGHRGITGTAPRQAKRVCGANSPCCSGRHLAQPNAFPPKEKGTFRCPFHLVMAVTLDQPGRMCKFREKEKARSASSSRPLPDGRGGQFRSPTALLLVGAGGTDLPPARLYLPKGSPCRPPGSWYFQPRKTSAACRQR